MLVGRAAERQLIDGLVAGARLGRSGVLLVVGEAGVGKTALIEYAADTASDVQVLRATGSEAETDVPFGGLAQLFRVTDRELERMPPPQAQALGVALALRKGPVADRLAVGAAVLGLLSQRSEQRPVGLVVDDAHLLDRPSVDALTFVCRRLLADPVFVLAAVREGEPCVLLDAGLPVHELAGLDLSATTALVRARGGDIPASVLSQVQAATGGNPLGVIALADEPGRLGELMTGDPAVPVPARITAWFRRRSESLGADAQGVLLVAAAAGGDLAAVARACPVLGLDVSAVAETERAGLLTVHPDRVEFVHPLARASVLSVTDPDVRRRVYRSLADTSPSAENDRRAWYLAHAALGPDDTAADAMQLAGERATERSAHAVAANAFHRSSQLTADPSARSARLILAGAAAWAAGDAGRARSLLDPVPDLDGSPRGRAELLALRGDIETYCGSPARAQGLLLDAADRYAAIDPSRAVVLLAQAVTAGFLCAQPGAALVAAARAESLLEQELTPVARAVGTLAAGMARVLGGRPGAELMRAGVDLLAAADDPAGAAIRPEWLMFGPLFLRERNGRALVRATLESGRARSAVGTLPALLLMIARDGAGTDQWTNAAADYGEAVALARELRQTSLLALALAGSAWLDARQGRPAECERHAAESLALSDQHSVNLARVWAEFALAELALVSGDAPGAVQRCSALLTTLAELNLADPDVSPTPELVEALLRSRRDSEAAAAAARYAEAADAKGLPWARARAARLRVLLCDADELDACYAHALALHQQTPDVFEQARTALAYGARLRRARRRADARGPLRAALDCFDQLGARPWAELAAAELTSTGETAARRSDDRRDALTPRELQIALLLAEGRTTRQTAAALFVSPKTVEYHLRHVYTKLGIANRTELATMIAAPQ